MKFLILPISIFFIGCKSISKSSDFTYHNVDEFNGVLVDEVHYNSQTGVYISKSLINDRTLKYKDAKIIIKLGEEQKKKLFNIYRSLNISNPNRCIYDNSTEKIIAKSVIRFYKNKTKWQDETCNVDIENKKFIHLWGEIDKAISSTPQYKEVFKFIGK